MRQVLLLTLFFQTIFFAEGQIKFQQIYSDTIRERAEWVEQTFDQGYILVGSSLRNEDTITWNYFYDIYLVKTDRFGNFEWGKTFGTMRDEYGCCVKQTKDSGFVILANNYYAGIDATIIKTNNQGDTLWTRQFTNGFNHLAAGFNIIETEDGGFVIPARSDSYDIGALIKLDAYGTPVWNSVFDFPGLTYFNYVTETMDHGFITVGANNSTGEYELLVVKTDSLGNLQWTGSYGTPESDVAFSVLQTAQNEYLIAGGTYQPQINKVILLKIDSVGNVIWENWYHWNANDKVSLQATSSDDFILCGTSLDTTLPLDEDIVALKINGAGDTLWTKTYRPNNYAECASVDITSDGGIVFCGATQYPGYFEHFYLVKTDSSGSSSCDEGSYPIDITALSDTANFLTCPWSVGSGNAYSYYDLQETTLGAGNLFCLVTGQEQLSDYSLCQLSPNPTTTTFSVTSDFSSIKSVEIFNLLGRKIYTSVVPNLRMWTIDCGNFKSGIYFVQVQTETGSFTQKLIKQ